MFEQAFRNIDDALRKEAGCATELDALATETRKLENIYGQKQAALAALKKSLLHQAFTGEL
jgi:type I restriction enzyme S subunit